VRKLGVNVNLGYFSQTRLDVLNPSRTVFEELMSATQRSVPQAQARTLLGVFNFRGDDVFKPVRVLSGGEKSRLILAKLLINPPNFICLDEPTTHLDIDGVEALTGCFQKYEGTLCFISHDLFFVQNVANHIVEVVPGELKNYHGNLDYYLEKKAATQLEKTSQRGKASGSPDHKKHVSHSSKDVKNQQLKQAQERHHEALKRLEEIKKESRALEAESKQLETESYVKSRFLSDAFGRDPNMIKEYGLRLKGIQKRIRDIVVILDQLQEEKNRISK
jgi:ATP-binding cassette subfamily F protein 3